ncbi:protein FAM227B-like [Physella acuta]|uniref:protein FAM227B-like n=1 Tax=Physella acuta TaxID=109671 RepID=UPI0027DD6B72|nr:protein FAM227B-like [Physella acuta]
MDYINRVGSPMDRLDESLDEAPEKIRLKKRQLKSKQGTKSPFLIGSIEDVNQKIGLLDKKLQNYTALVCESRASSEDEYLYRSASAKKITRNLKIANENKEVCKFAGMYTIKTTLAPKISERAKNITKISMKTNQKQNGTGIKGDPSKPKFVELYQYPGFDATGVTHLPGDLTSTDIFVRVLKASGYHCGRPNYQEVKRLLFSSLSEAIFLDIFWYFFQEKFQPSPSSQANIFNRVADNYVSLMMDNTDPILKDLFFMDFPKLMSQAIYSAFCFSFPDSYRQFGETFKNDLTFLVHEWMTGIRPAPRNWLSWDMNPLEPANIKQREELMNKKSGSPLINFDYLDSLIDNHTSPMSTTVPSISSTQANTSPRKTVSHSMTGSSSPTKPLSPISLSSNGAIEAVADAQIYRTKKLSLQHREGQELKRFNNSLVPIKESDSDNDKGESLALRTVGNILDKKYSRKHEAQSHPVGHGCDFAKLVFNRNGKSPLVAHFLKRRGLEKVAGKIVRLQRVEMVNLPALDAPTYKDVIEESSKNIQRIRNSFQGMYRTNQHERQIFLKEQQTQMKDYMHKQSALLANKKEVKRLSDLIIMEQRKSQDSVSAGAEAAIEAALKAQD